MLIGRSGNAASMAAVAAAASSSTASTSMPVNPIAPSIRSASASVKYSADASALATSSPAATRSVTPRPTPTISTSTCGPCRIVPSAPNRPSSSSSQKVITTRSPTRRPVRSSRLSLATISSAPVAARPSTIRNRPAVLAMPGSSIARELAIQVRSGASTRATVRPRNEPRAAASTSGSSTMTSRSSIAW